MEQLRKQLAEAERKSARTIHDVRILNFVDISTNTLMGNVAQLNKEVGELESIVETKVSNLLIRVIMTC